MDITTAKHDIQSNIDAQWFEVWQNDRQRFESLYKTEGEPAYGAYMRALFECINRQAKASGVVSTTYIPGPYQVSIEKWGQEEERERCFWCVLQTSDGFPLGILITHFFLP
jgi:hypothetical protein